MSETPFYYGFAILHPYHKMSWFKEKWHGYAEWLKTIEHGMKEVVNGYEEKLGGDVAVQRMKDESGVTTRRLTQARKRERAELLALGVDSSDEDTIFQAHSQAEAVNSRRTKHPRIESQLVRWNKLPQEDVDSPLQSWMEMRKYRDNNSPILSKIALYLFSISVTSAECERVFYETKRRIRNGCSRLLASTIEAIQCQNNWLDNESRTRQPTILDSK